mmetsp:Transcript_80597/g.261199  ORF Transcript_80597/g.261199 Transcript_80597/m.261199 type:complete len:239 (+) Transcript_80597:1866-2582(+)
MQLADGSPAAGGDGAETHRSQRGHLQRRDRCLRGQPELGGGHEAAARDEAARPCPGCDLVQHGDRRLWQRRRVAVGAAAPGRHAKPWGGTRRGELQRRHQRLREGWAVGVGSAPAERHAAPRRPAKYGHLQRRHSSLRNVRAEGVGFGLVRADARARLQAGQAYIQRSHRHRRHRAGRVHQQCSPGGRSGLVQEGAGAGRLHALGGRGPQVAGPPRHEQGPGEGRCLRRGQGRPHACG